MQSHEDMEICDTLCQNATRKWTKMWLAAYIHAAYYVYHHHHYYYYYYTLRYVDRLHTATCKECVCPADPLRARAQPPLQQHKNAQQIAHFPPNCPTFCFLQDLLIDGPQPLSKVQRSRFKPTKWVPGCPATWKADGLRPIQFASKPPAGLQRFRSVPKLCGFGFDLSAPPPN